MKRKRKKNPTKKVLKLLWKHLERKRHNDSTKKIKSFASVGVNKGLEKVSPSRVFIQCSEEELFTGAV